MGNTTVPRKIIGNVARWIMAENDDKGSPPAKPEPEANEINDDEAKMVEGKEPPPSPPPRPPLLLASCHSCGHNFSKRASSCPKCGAVKLAECHICKKQIPANSESCSECGDPEPFAMTEGTRKHEHKTEEIKAADNIASHFLGRVPQNNRIILVVGVTIIVLMGIFPPWAETIRRNGEIITSGNSIGYSFLFDPPRSTKPYVGSVNLDWSRLGLQWALVAIAFGCAAWAVKTRQLRKTNKAQSEHPAGIFKKKMSLFPDFVIFFLFKHFEDHTA